jgi:hypothetical protein
MGIINNPKRTFGFVHTSTEILVNLANQLTGELKFDKRHLRLFSTDAGIYQQELRILHNDSM